MKKAKELKSSNLKNSFNIDSLKFETTEEVEPFKICNANSTKRF